MRVNVSRQRLKNKSKIEIKKKKHSKSQNEPPTATWEIMSDEKVSGCQHHLMLLLMLGPLWSSS